MPAPRCTSAPCWSGMTIVGESVQSGVVWLLAILMVIVGEKMIGGKGATLVFIYM